MFALRVRGDSMIDEQIREDDFIILQSQQTADNGQTVVALIDGSDATVKRFYSGKITCGLKLQIHATNQLSSGRLSDYRFKELW